MPFRQLATAELANLLSVLSHPQRIRIIEELRSQEHDVNFLADALGTSHSRVSQHLALLRNHRLVETRREGRHVYYHLSRGELATWLVQGLDFVEAELAHNESVRGAVNEARAEWTRR